MIKSGRTKTGKPSDGRHGHDGKRLEPVADPDHVVDHHVAFCNHCNAPMPEPEDGYKSRQVFDVPPVKVKAAKLLHTDETGVRTEGEVYCMHVCSIRLVTLYFLHPRRGLLAMGDIGILAEYSGTAAHDR